MGLDDFKSGWVAPDVTEVEHAEYIAQLLDTEGNITMGIQTSDDNSIGYSVNPSVTVGQSFKKQAAALIDGDGNINVGPSKSEGSVIGYDFSTTISVAQNMDKADKLARFHILTQQLCSDVGVKHNYSIYETDGGIQYKWRVANIDDMYSLLKAVEEYMVLKCEEAHIFAEQIYPLMKDKKHTTEDGFIEVMEWVDLMAEHSQSSGKRKYNAEYFKTEFR